MRELTFMTAMPAKAAPVVDGVLDDACWEDAVPHSDYYEYLVPNPRRVTNTKTDCMIVYDAKGVTTGIRNWEDQPAKLRMNCKKNNQGDIWLDDCAEIYYDPEAAGIGYYKFIVNCLGKFDTAWRMDGANMHEDWTTGGVVAAAKIFADRWELEIFVPWSAMHGRQGPKPGDVWTFNHSRFRFGALGWGAGFSTSAPGGSGVSANKFGYLYFSDGSKPDAQKVLAMLEQRLNTVWGISINGQVYVHDTTGTRASDLNAQRDAIEKDFTGLESGMSSRIAAAKSDAAKKLFAETRAAFTNELASFDGSFASVKILGELRDKMRDVSFELAVEDLASTNPAVIAAAKAVALPLAGTYDLEPPKQYDGHNGWNRHNFVKDAYKTPYLPWGERVAGKVPKILFMPGFGTTARDLVEYMQRFETEALWFPGDFGATGIYQDPLSLGTHLDKRRQFETLLAKNPDIVVINGFNVGEIPACFRYELLRRVRDEGLGLVTIGWAPFVGNFLRTIPADTAARQALAASVPVAELPGLVPPSSRQPPPGVTRSEERLACARFGKGRIASINHNLPGWSLLWRGMYESRSAFLWNVVRWVQGEEPGADIQFASDVERDSFAAVSHFFPFRAVVGKGGADTLECRLRNALNDVLDVRVFPLQPGGNMLAISTEKLPGGDYYLDLVAKKGGRTCAVTVRPFSKASPVGGFTMEGTNTAVVAEGRPGDLRFAWEAPLLEKATLRFELYDMPYRQLRITNAVPLSIGARAAAVRVPAMAFPTLAALARTRIVAEDGRELGAVDKMVYFPNHRFEDYTLISWGGVGETPFSDIFAPQLVEEFGYRNQLGERGARPANFNGRAVPYIAHVSLGGTTNGTNWRTLGHTRGGPSKEEKEHFETVVSPDLNPYRPEVREYLLAGFEQKVRETVPYGVSVWSLGDECGYSDSVGFGEKSRVYFDDFLKYKYGTIANFNAVHGTACTDFPDVPHKTVQQSVKDADWASWYDQVQYAEKMYSDLYQFLSKAIKKYDPKARVGAEGSAAGDLEQTVAGLEFWGPYRSLVNDELLRNIAPDRVRGTWWGGYLRSTRNGFPVQQWEYVLTGTVNADEWFAVSPGSTEGAFVGDLTFYPYVTKMMPHLKALRRGLAQLLIRTPFRNDGFALYYNHHSTQASKLDDRLLPPADSQGDFIRFCYRKGYETRFVTPKTLDRLNGLKVLFLAGASALSDAEVQAILDFARAGGIVVADTVPAMLNEYLVQRTANPLAECFGAKLLKDLPSPETQPCDFKATVAYGDTTASLAMKSAQLKTFPGLDGLVWNPVGKGGALLLNFTLSSALVSTDEGTVDALLQGILDLKGIRNPESVAGLPADGTVFRVRELPLGKGANGGPAAMRLAGYKIYVKALGSAVTLDFGKEGWVYECDKGFIAKTGKVAVQALDIPFKLYAQFDEEQSAPTLALDRTAVDAGDWVSFETKPLRPGGVYRMEILDPAGAAISCREELFAVDALKPAARRFQFPYSDKPGVWKVSLRDIATGLEARVAVTVR